MRQLIREVTRAIGALARRTAGGQGGPVDPLTAAQAELAERQRELATSETRLSLALGAAGDGLFDYRRGGPIFFSETFYAMFGYAQGAEELKADDWLRFVHPDDTAAMRHKVCSLHAGRTDLLAAECRIRTAAGQWKWVLLRGRVFERAATGVPMRMIGTVQDIDNRRRADAAARESQELFRNAFEESAVGMALVRPDGKILRANAPFTEITGYTEAELTDRRFQDITFPDDLEADMSHLNDVIRGKSQHYTIEKRYVRKDGDLVWVLLNVGVVLDDAGGPLYFVSQVQNITQRKRDEADLQAYAQRLEQTTRQLERSTAELITKTAEAEAAKAVAEEAVRAKSAFLANISHEIRTPMAAIIGFANLLTNDTLSPEERAHSAETVARQGQHLLALVNDILDLSKAEAGKMDVEFIECDPRQVLADVEAMTAARADEKGLNIHFRVDAGVPGRVRSDPTRLRQVLVNVVGNAIKFTHRGEIRVDLTCGECPGGAAGLKFVVVDTGIGMDEWQLGHIFEPFSQADTSTTRRFGGTGLGLAISKRLVEMMRGAITVQSRPGEGSRFEICVEAPACPSPPAVPAIAPTLREGVRVLLAEDGRDNQRLIMFYLRHAGIAVELAENGRIAVDRVLAARADGVPFDLILMDMQMPEMDGVAACEALREAGVVTPTVALTAHGSDDARVLTARAGCVGHLVKPVDHVELVRTIAVHTDAATGR